jgi:outer membrane protein TolC
MKKIGIFLFLLQISVGMTQAQTLLRLSDCRNLALENNKQLKIGRENVTKASEEKKAAFTQYLPDISLKGAYLYNQRKISLLDENKFLPVGTMTPETGFAPNGTFAILPQNSFDLDIHNVFSGVASVVQPVYMGGKIAAYNKITGYAEELAQTVNETGIRDVILQVDQAYWQTVSLAGKHTLSQNYVSLLQQMDHDVQAMITEGVATRAEGLSVKVKLNEAEMTLTQVENGWQLSRMLLCRLCGLPLDENIVLADSADETVSTTHETANDAVNEAFANRSELKSLDLAAKIFKKKEALVVADMLPTVALAGNYIVTNPNSFNGFQNKFAGSWNVGVLVNVPVFHWGEKQHQLRVAQAETRIKQAEMAEAKEKIELQVNQTTFKLNEAQKKLRNAGKNKESAEENLRYANLGFKEGIIPSLNVMEAQTAWFKAESELIDAKIAVALGQAELEKALGTKN